MLQREDHVEVSLKGTSVPRLAMLPFMEQRRQLRRILGHPTSRLPRGKNRKDGLRALVGQKEARGVRSGAEDMIGIHPRIIRRRSIREAHRDARFRAKARDGGAHNCWALIMVEDI